MPNRWAVADGNWSDSAIWSGSLIPTAADDVFTNNRVVILNQDITVSSIRNVATGSAVAGGRIEIYNNYTINCTSIQGSSTTVYLIFNYNTGSTTLNAILNSSAAGLCVDNISTGTINIVGDIFAPNNVSTGNLYSVRNFSSGILNITGNVRPIAGNNGSGNGTIRNNQNGTVNITGDVIGGAAGGGGFSTIILNANVGPINVTGNVIGSTIAGGASSQAIQNQSIAQVNVTGNVTANIWPAITSTTAGTIIVRGSISSSITANGISSTSTTATNLFTGPFYNTGSFNAVYAYRMQIIEPTSTSWRFDTEVAGVSKTLYTANQLPGVPRQNNVRKGTQYNFGLTGSLEMPDPTTVKQGVATDNTVGSAVLTAQDMFDVLTQDIVTTGSIGDVLKNTSTVQTVAATVSAFKV